MSSDKNKTQTHFDFVDYDDYLYDDDDDCWIELKYSALKRIKRLCMLYGFIGGVATTVAVVTIALLWISPGV